MSKIFSEIISIKIIILRSEVITFIIVSEPKPVTSGKINTKIPHKTPGMTGLYINGILLLLAIFELKIRDFIYVIAIIDEIIPII